METLIAEAAESVDRQLAALAVTMAGGPREAAELLRSISQDRQGKTASDFLLEAGALLRARRLLAQAMQS